MDSVRQLQIKILQMCAPSRRSQKEKLERLSKIKHARAINEKEAERERTRRELFIIQREKSLAEDRNRRLVEVAESRCEQVNKCLVSHRVKDSEEKLRTAKTKFGEIIAAEYPEWNKAIFDHVGFKTGLLRQNAMTPANKEKSTQVHKLRKEPKAGHKLILDLDSSDECDSTRHKKKSVRSSNLTYSMESQRADGTDTIFTPKTTVSRSSATRTFNFENECPQMLQLDETKYLSHMPIEAVKKNEKLYKTIRKTKEYAADLSEDEEIEVSGSESLSSSEGFPKTDSLHMIVQEKPKLKLVHNQIQRSPTFGITTPTKSESLFFPAPKTYESVLKASKSGTIVELKADSTLIETLPSPSRSEGNESNQSFESPTLGIDN